MTKKAINPVNSISWMVCDINIIRKAISTVNEYCSISHRKLLVHAPESTIDLVYEAWAYKNPNLVELNTTPTFSQIVKQHQLQESKP